MNEPVDDRHLLRLVHGELVATEAERLYRRLRTDTDLRARYEQLESAWQGLELAPPSPLPDGWRQETLDLASRCDEQWGWRAAPLWVRAGATAALLVGVLLGNAVAAPSASERHLGEQPAEWLSPTPPTSGLADSYWQALAEDRPLDAEWGAS